MNKYFKALATKEEITSREVYESIQELINVAWATTDPETKLKQHKLFGDSKPNPEQLIQTLASEIIKQKNQPTSSTYCS